MMVMYTPASHPCGLQFLESDIAERCVRRLWRLSMRLGGGGVVAVFRNIGKKILLHVGQDLGKPFLEFVEVFLVKENLVLVKGETSVNLLPALALSDGQIVVVIALCGLDIKEIGPFSGPYWFGVNVL